MHVLISPQKGFLGCVFGRAAIRKESFACEIDLSPVPCEELGVTSAMPCFLEAGDEFLIGHFLSRFASCYGHNDRECEIP